MNPTLPLTPPDLAAPPAARPQPGTGTRLTLRGDLWSLSADPGTGRFGHPWKPALAAGGIRLSKGLVEVYEPKIGKVPMSGDARTAPPLLKLDVKIANEDGESWVCLEVAPGGLRDTAGRPVLGEDGFPQLRSTLDGDSRIQIIHTDEPLVTRAAIGRCPLVQLLWRNGRVAKAFPIVHFNLRYQRVELPPGEGAARHLFF